MKKIASLVLIFCFCLTVMIGCGQSQPAQPAADKQDKGPQVVLELANWFPDDQTSNVELKTTIDNIVKKSDGRIQIKVFSNGTYGTEENCTAALKMGALDMMDITPNMDAYPPIGVLLAPYAFRDYDHWGKFKKSDVYTQLLKDASEASGWEYLCLYSFGFRQTHTKSVAAKAPADFSKVKLRVVNVVPYQEAATVLNAIPTPLPITEVYMALKTGVVDGAENPLEQIYTMKFYEVDKNLILTGHMLASSSIAISRKKWSTLSKEDQDLLRTEFEDYANRCDAKAQAVEQDYLKKLQDAGMNVIKPDLKPFMDRGDLAMKKYPQWQDLYNKIRAIQ